MPLWFVSVPPAWAQVMQGPWVEESNRKIDAIRKTDLRVIVLDADGRPAPRAVVRIEQLRHDFELGFVVGEAGLPHAAPGAPVLRCFNAVSLERFTDWPRLQPDAGREPDFAAVDALLDEAQRAGLTVAWGPVISADLARNPPWLAFLEGPALATALRDHVHRIARRYGARIGAFDLVSHSLDHRFVEDKLGLAALRTLHHEARADAPHAAVVLRLDNSLTETRLTRATAHADAWRSQFIPFDRVSIPQRIGGILLQRQLTRGLELLGTLGAPVTVGPLEVGGSSDAAAADNLETLLRLLFASESVRGLYVSGLTVADVADPTAALIDNAGAPLAPGAVFDGLFCREWFTNQTHAADELGNVYARVFAGTHRVTAALGDGTELAMTVNLSKSPPPGLAQHILLLEPPRSDAAPPR